MTGLPCSGKSRLATLLAARSGWPLLAKDAIKESLFDTLGWQDRAWSRRMSRASYGLMFDLVPSLLTAHAGLILEGNFRPEEHDVRFAQLAQEHGVAYTQVFCRADPEVLVARFELRTRQQLRHPGHVDAESLHEIVRELRSGSFSALSAVGAPVIWDSTHATASELEQFVRALIRDHA